MLLIFKPLLNDMVFFFLLTRILNTAVCSDHKISLYRIQDLGALVIDLISVFA